MTANEKFAQEVLSLCPEASEFKPSAYYDSDGDCIEFIAVDEPFKAERIDRWVTVYYSRKTGDIIGSQIKQVSKLLSIILKHKPNFRLNVKDGRIKLTHFFTIENLQLEERPDEQFEVTYEKLRQTAKNVDAEVEIGTLVAA